MDFQGRTNILVTPTNPDGSLIIALHGGSGSPSAFKIQIALEASFPNSYILYVDAEDGNNNQWRAGGDFGDGLEDYNYLRDLVKHMIYEYPVFASQVHMLGYSNGCMMMYRYVNKDTNAKFASVTGISGSYIAPEDFTYTGKILHLHGTDDPTVPKGGSAKYQSTDDMQAAMKKTSQITVESIGNVKHDFDDIKTKYPNLNERIKLFMGL